MFFVFLANLRQIFLIDMHSTIFIILFNKNVILLQDNKKNTIFACERYNILC